MSYKNSLLKLALNNTPKAITLWAVNKKLKGLAELTDFEFNSDERKLYAEVVLAGEEEAIEVSLDDITLITDEEPYKLVIQQVKSSRPWLDALLTRVVLNREWKIPESQAELVHELFAVKSEPEQEDD